MTSEEIDLDSDAEFCRANSGAFRFQVKSITGFAQLSLHSINDPRKELYIIVLANITNIEEIASNVEDHYLVATATTDFIDLRMQFHEFWLSWFNGEICVGLGDCQEPFIKYTCRCNLTEVVGYIKFAKTYGSHHLVEWIFETSPIVSNPTPYKKISGGELRWVTLTNHKLPPDALIGGFENEPLYIACAVHNGSISPGKYVPSKRLAFIAWGGVEYPKDQFRILCGYNATWVETSGNKIPQNAFIGGVSEVHRGPLYIGRAVHDGHLINGKIHVIYETCYLPYKGKEVEVYSFEILVLPNINPRCILADFESRQ